MSPGCIRRLQSFRKGMSVVDLETGARTYDNDLNLLEYFLFVQDVEATVCPWWEVTS